MTNFNASRSFTTSQYPVHAQETSGLLKRVEPFLTPELFRSRYLKGIPNLFPQAQFSDEEIKDRIILAQNETEAQLNTTITREEFKDKLAFDFNLYKAFMHMKTRHSPIISLERLAIVASNSEVIFQVPSVWVETSNFSLGQINVIPLLAAFGATSVTGTSVTATGQAAGVAFLAIWGAMGNIGAVPGYWEVTYSAGLSNREGHVPVIVNQLIGINAAIDIISQIAQAFLYTSQSLSQDSISQSSSSLGPRAFQLRIEELTKKRDELISKIKGIFSKKWVIGEY